MNKGYWQRFYKTKRVSTPSLFAKFCLPRIKGNISLVDLGCGNGRDSLYFEKHGFLVDGVDESSNVKDDGGTTFFHRGKIENYIKKYSPSSVVYCRFLFHAVGETVEDRILDWAHGILCAEMRSDKGTFKGHKRRLINGKKFLNKLIQRGYEILYYDEGTGFAPFGKEDPVIIRVIARR